MSQFPNPYQPIQYQSAPIGPPSLRPTSVTVLAIFGIIFGGLGTLCTPFGLIPYFTQFGPPNPVIEAMRKDTVLFPWTIVSTLIGFVIAVVLLSASIAALSLKPWARRALVGYGVATIVMGLIGFVFNLGYVFPRLHASLANLPGGPEALRFMPYTTIGGSVIGLILPCFMVYFMTRPNVKAAFAVGKPPYPPGGGYGPVPPGGYAQ